MAEEGEVAAAAKSQNLDSPPRANGGRSLVEIKGKHISTRTKVAYDRQS
jgi:hypothetical protein